jgi:tRNA uridine 5-carbamoylmethylation protein Kti12
MLYLFGGPPRCGKTTLSVALAKKLQIPYFSIDHITSVISPYIATECQDEGCFPKRRFKVSQLGVGFACPANEYESNGTL